MKPGQGNEREFDEGEDDGKTHDEGGDEVEFGLPHKLDRVGEGVDAGGGEGEVDAEKWGKQCCNVA